MNRDLILGSVLYTGDHILSAAGPDDAQRFDLEDARVAGIHLQEDVIAMDISFDDAAQVSLNAIAFLIHADPGLRLQASTQPLDSSYANSQEGLPTRRTTAGSVCFNMPISSRPWEQAPPADGLRTSKPQGGVAERGSSGGRSGEVVWADSCSRAAC